jgi:hypothetical protein
MCKKKAHTNVVPQYIPVIAADASILQSASSFITPVCGLSDPRASQAFDSVVTAFCNNCNLVLPLPKSDSGNWPLLLSLWRKTNAVSELHNLEIDDKIYQYISDTIADKFAVYAEGVPYDVARWVAFQFTPTLVSQYLIGCHGLESILRTGPIISKLLSSGKLKNFTDAVLTLHKNQEFREPKEYSTLVGTPEVPSFLHLCASYSLSFCIRGWSYAAKIGMTPENPIYRHLWLRAPALRADVEDLFIRIPDKDTVELFPWGHILLSIFDQQNPLTSRTPGRVEEVLIGIRERSIRLGEELTRILRVLAHPGIQTTPKLTEEEILVLDLLRELKIWPRFANTTRPERLTKWLRQIFSDALPFLKIPVEIVTSNTQSTLLRRIETAFRIQFRRDTFWDIFENPGIQKTR